MVTSIAAAIRSLEGGERRGEKRKGRQRRGERSFIGLETRFQPWFQSLGHLHLPSAWNTGRDNGEGEGLSATLEIPEPGGRQLVGVWPSETPSTWPPLTDLLVGVENEGEREFCQGGTFIH